ncbi:MAG: ATP-binding cassette domain-containing protein [Flavobacteriales bacterium]|nr:ATP-binding cassette domain-containing protein [Flavobacteriales bacterium]
MIKVENISFAYKGSDTMSFPNFELKQGEHALVLGQSGCGKTTLLHLMAGLITPDSGTVQIDDTIGSKLSGSAMDRFRGGNIGVIFQKPHFIKAINVIDNVLLAQKLGGKKKDKAKAVEVLTTLGLSHKINAKVTDLSEGEKQRVSIARALVNEPKLILADEPTSALDDQNCNAVLELLKRVSEKSNSTLLIVTHDNRLKDQIDKKIEL